MATVMPQDEATMEAVLPILVTDVMQALERQGKHPEEDFSDRLRVALRQIVPQHPTIEDDIWDHSKKEKIVAELCQLINL